MASSISEYATTPVTPDALINGTRIVLILLGLMVALPAFVMGAELGHSLGATRAISASLIGGGILAVIAALCGVAGARSRLSTYMLIIDAFGTRGALLANGLLSVALLGAFGVIAMMFGRAMISANTALFAHVSVAQMSLVGCVLMIITAIVGMRALDGLSLLITPLKIGLLLFTFAMALKGGLSQAWSFIPSDRIALGTGVSMVTGGLIIGATLAPDICRFARTPMQAALACAGAYGLGFPLILVLSALPSLATGEHDIVAIMLTLGLGLPAMLVVLLTAWATNAYNLYAASLVLATMRPRQPRWHLVLASGMLGAALGLWGIDEKLMAYFLWLSIAIPPIAGVYLTNFYLKLWRQSGNTAAPWRWDALLAWALGTGYAALPTSLGASITPVPALDSILVSAISYAAWRSLMHVRRSRNPGQRDWSGEATQTPN